MSDVSETPLSTPAGPSDPDLAERVPADKLDSAIDRLTAVLVGISQKLDRNIVLQFAAVSVAFVYLLAPRFNDVIGEFFRIPEQFVQLALPVVLLKLYMDWASYSIHYILVRRDLEACVAKYYEVPAKDRFLDLFVPPSFFKYFFRSDLADMRLTGKILYFFFNSLLVFFLAVSAFLLVAYAYFSLPAAWLRITAVVIIGLVYLSFYSAFIVKLWRLSHFRNMAFVTAAVKIVLTIWLIRVFGEELTALGGIWEQVAAS